MYGNALPALILFNTILFKAGSSMSAGSFAGGNVNVALTGGTFVRRLSI